ncbi:hypothetical protein [Nocardioides sp. WS12]|uniref:hypothetical protein n=1 Tax=Nocardioides sp. WS12 TaxID=2486272 RepID=UPI0015FD37DC|nr:hypothetical protein [Nocardioides sp. WS12]
MTEANPGRFHRVDPDVLDDDPFWSEVRRRHPDVDIVLLPPDPSPDPSPDPDLAPASDTEVRRAAVAVQEVWRGVRPLLAGFGPLAPPSVRWREAEGRRSLILQKALPGIDQQRGTELLMTLLVHLGERGWALQPGVRDGLPTLRATDGAAAVEAVAGPGATVMTLTGVPLVLTVEVAQLVKDEVRAEVASWE